MRAIEALEKREEMAEVRVELFFIATFECYLV